MKKITAYFGWILILLISSTVMAQQITYSNPQREDDYRQTEFEIIGKVNIFTPAPASHILVYKNVRDHYLLSVYDENMELVKNTPLSFLENKKVIGADFVALSDYFLMIYQYQEGAYVYCYGSLMDGNGEPIQPSIMIDSSQVGRGQVKTKIYSVIRADDHNRILVYKINQDKDYNNIFYTFLYDNRLNLVNNSRLTLAMKDRHAFLSDFSLSNDGHFFFVKEKRSGSNGNLNEASLVVKPPMTDSFTTHPLDLKGHYLDEVELRLDNKNKKTFLASFYTERRRGDIIGLYAGEYSWENNQFNGLKFIPFDDNLRMNARQGSSVRGAFNNYFIRQLVVRGDGGFLLTAEAYYTSSRYQPWNRWNYMYSPWGFSPYYYPYYYSPFSPWYYSPYGWDNNRGTEYHYDDIAILSYDGDGKLEWSNFIRKNQSAEGNASFLSYKLVNIGSELEFIYNSPFRRSYLLTVMSVTPQGKLSKLPTLRGLDNGYDWMPRYGRQISARSVVIPCIFRNYICFAKIDF